jgi:hypothetical protein
MNGMLLVKAASSKEGQLCDLHADWDNQISRYDQLPLVDLNDCWSSFERPCLVAVILANTIASPAIDSPNARLFEPRQILPNGAQQSSLANEAPGDKGQNKEQTIAF